MTEWHESTIGELGRVVTGKTPPAARPEAFGEDHPFVTPTDMVDQRYMVMTARYLSADGAELLRRTGVPAGALMVSCIGWQLGKVAFSTADSFTNQQINTIIPDTSRVDPLFLYYHLRTRREELKRLASGGTRTPILNKSRFERLTVPLPPRPSQEMIATFLGSIDDLIENNRRRVAVLEEIARAVYREWFVKFRYPGHEDIPLVDSALGPVPDGWFVRALRDASAVVVRGISPKYAEDGDWVVLNQKCIRDGRVSFAPSRRQEREVSDVKRIRFGDVLINSTGVGTLGRVAMYRGPSEGVTVDSHVTISRPAEQSLNPWYALSVLSMQAEIERLGTGATGQTELRKTDVEALELSQPVSAVLDAFSATASPLLEQVDVLLTQTETLSTLRDLLLPKLVTGQIDVSALDLEALVEEGVRS